MIRSFFIFVSLANATVHQTLAAASARL